VCGEFIHRTQMMRLLTQRIKSSIFDQAINMKIRVGIQTKAMQAIEHCLHGFLPEFTHFLKLFVGHVCCVRRSGYRLIHGESFRFLVDGEMTETAPSTVLNGVPQCSSYLRRKGLPANIGLPIPCLMMGIETI
jgi:hypothetical protein